MNVMHCLIALNFFCNKVPLNIRKLTTNNSFLHLIRVTIDNSKAYEWRKKIPNMIFHYVRSLSQWANAHMLSFVNIWFENMSFDCLIVATWKRKKKWNQKAYTHSIKQDFLLVFAPAIAWVVHFTVFTLTFHSMHNKNYALNAKTVVGALKPPQIWCATDIIVQQQKKKRTRNIY